MTPGILPSALRAGSAVRTAPAAQCPKVAKRLGADRGVPIRVSESECPVLLAVAGSLRQYIHVLLRDRGDPSPRPYGHSPATPV